VFEHPDRRRLFLMRHAEAAYIRDDGTVAPDVRAVPLTADGRAQAQCHRDVLTDVPFDRAVCSGLERTRETAAILLEGRSRPSLEIVPALEEVKGGDRRTDIADPAAWIRHIANPWATAAEDEDARFLGGERFRDLEARVIGAFNALLEDPTWCNLLLVAHGGVNRVIMNHVLGARWQARMSIEQDACCINIIDFDMHRGKVVRSLVRGINITAYNLSKQGIRLTDMERTAERVAALIAGARAR
jgi:probable phosphoglycerate mutase